MRSFSVVVDKPGVLRAGGSGDLGGKVVIEPHVRFEVQGFDLEAAFFAVGFGVHAPDQCAVHQQRQAEVAVLALGLRRADAVSFSIDVASALR